VSLATAKATKATTKKITNPRIERPNFVTISSLRANQSRKFKVDKECEQRIGLSSRTVRIETALLLPAILCCSQMHAVAL
jgi:hypothetical protein